MKVLVLAPHPDDEIIGVGGTILKHVHSGDSVSLLIFTKAHEPFWDKSTILKKSREVQLVSDFLKIKELIWLDFKTTTLGSLPGAEISSRIEHVVEKIKPDIVYSPPKGDVHIDHDVVANYTLSVVKKFPKISKVLFYEEPQNTQYNSQLSYFVPNYFVDISPFINKKLAALNMYKTEKKTYPHPRSAKALKMAAGVRGGAIFVKYAEAFMLVRERIV